MTDDRDRGLRARRTTTDDREQELRALRDRVKELERRNEMLERAVAAEEAKLTPRQRAIVDTRLAERDPARHRCQWQGRGGFRAQPVQGSELTAR
jgi:hypothetical protein